MNKYTLRRKADLEHAKQEKEKLFAAIYQMNDQDFLGELRKLHSAFMYEVVDIMARGRCAKYLFRSVAKSIAESRDYIFLCDRIYIPVCFQERLMKILNEEQAKFKQFKDEDQIKEQLEAQAKTNVAEAGQV